MAHATKLLWSFGLFSNINEGYYYSRGTITSCQTPGQLRFLFSRIILEGYPACPLWDHFNQDLALDYITATLLRSGELIVPCSNLRVLQDGGHSLKNYGLPEPTLRFAEVVAELEAFEGRHDGLRHKSDEMVAHMNDEQTSIFNHIIDSVMEYQQSPDVPNTRPEASRGKHI